VISPRGSQVIETCFHGRSRSGYATQGNDMEFISCYGLHQKIMISIGVMAIIIYLILSILFTLSSPILLLLLIPIFVITLIITIRIMNDRGQYYLHHNILSIQNNKHDLNGCIIIDNLSLNEINEIYKTIKNNNLKTYKYVLEPSKNIIVLINNNEFIIINPRRKRELIENIRKNSSKETSIYYSGIASVSYNDILFHLS